MFDFSKTIFKSNPKVKAMTKNVTKNTRTALTIFITISLTTALLEKSIFASTARPVNIRLNKNP